MDQLATKFCYLVFGYSPVLTGLIYVLSLIIVRRVSKRLQNPVYIYLLIVIGPSIIYVLRLLFNDYFLSDDFDHFVLADKYSYLQIFIKGISGDNLWAFHRLFTGFWLFKLIYALFGTNYYAFAILNWIIHVLNTLLVFSFTRKLTKSLTVSSVSAFIFNSFYLTWISNIHELLASLFLLISILTLHRYLFETKIKSKTLYTFSFISYILGIYSKEVVFIFPLIFLLLFITLSNFTKRPSYLKWNLVKIVRETKIFFVTMFLYLIIFIKDFMKFSEYETGSGYDTVYKLNVFLDHLTYYISQNTPIFKGLLGFSILILLIVSHDIYRKKLILLPLSVSYLALIFPVLLLNKATVYYSYIPFIFLIIGFAVVLRSIHTGKLLFTVFIAFSFIFVFGLNTNFQENCFLLQFPRPHPRRLAIEEVVNKANSGKEIDKDNQMNDDTVWFVENNYLKYFLPKK